MTEIETEHRHLTMKVKDALRGGRTAWRCMSTGEKVAVALILNKENWLKEIKYSMAEAIDRIGTAWISLVPRIEKELRDEGMI